MALKIFGYPGCTTVKKSRGFAEANGLDVEYSHFSKVDDLRGELEIWIKGAGIDAVFNHKAQTFKKMTEAERHEITATEKSMLDAMAAEPRLIKRPVGTDGKSVLTGFDEDQWRATFL